LVTTEKENMDFFIKKSKKTNGAYELTYELSGRESKA
jgi:hypothetical protein